MSIYPPTFSIKHTALSMLVLSLILSNHTHASNTFAEKIFLGDIITVNDAQPSVQALAILNGKIIAVGDKTSVLRHKGPDTQTIALNSHTLMPGFIDSHTHPILASMMAETIDISGFNHDGPEQVMLSLKQGIYKNVLSVALRELSNPCLMAS